MIARIDEKIKEVKPENVVTPLMDDIEKEHVQKIKAPQAEVDLLNGEIDGKDKSIQALPVENKTLRKEIAQRDQVFRNQEEKMQKMNTELNLLKDKSKRYVETTDEIKEKSLQLHRENEILRLSINHLREEATTMKKNLEFAQSLALQAQKALITTSKETTEKVDETSVIDECVIIGDSLVKHLNTDWLLVKEGVAVKYRKASKIEDVQNALDGITSQSRCIVLHVGTNNLQSTPTDEIVDALVKSADQAKTISQKVIVSTITPRYDNASLNIKAQLINATLQDKLAKKQGISINDNSNLNVRPNYTGKFYSDDKLHLSEQGNKIFAQNVKMAI